MEKETAQRFAILEMYLLFWGKIQRKDLQAHFDIGPVTASRLLKAYEQAHPNNVYYCVHAKAYIWQPTFTVHYPIAAEVALELLCYGNYVISISREVFGTHSPILTPKLDCTAVAHITRAIVNNEGIELHYISASSGFSLKKLYPHAIFKGGQSWYFRAFDTEKQEYRSYRFSRALSQHTKPLTQVLPEKKYRQSIDKDWETSVTLTLAPHKTHTHSDALRQDLGLRDQPVHNIQVNAVTAPFVLIDMRVDCSPDGKLNSNEYPLQLLNTHEVKNIQGISMAPGYCL